MRIRYFIFDGVCHLCAASVRFVIRRDPEQRFYFSRLQSKVSQQLLAAHNATDTGLDSVILIYRGQIYRKSRAALRTALLLNRGWPLMGLFLLVPRSSQIRYMTILAATATNGLGKADLAGYRNLISAGGFWMWMRALNRGSYPSI